MSNSWRWNAWSGTKEDLRRLLSAFQRQGEVLWQDLSDTDQAVALYDASTIVAHCTWADGASQGHYGTAEEIVADIDVRGLDSLMVSKYLPNDWLTLSLGSEGVEFHVCASSNRYHEIAGQLTSEVKKCVPWWAFVRTRARMRSLWAIAAFVPLFAFSARSEWLGSRWYVAPILCAAVAVLASWTASPYILRRWLPGFEATEHRTLHSSVFLSAVWAVLLAVVPILLSL